MADDDGGGGGFRNCKNWFHPSRWARHDGCGRSRVATCGARCTRKRPPTRGARSGSRVESGTDCAPPNHGQVEQAANIWHTSAARVNMSPTPGCRVKGGARLPEARVLCLPPWHSEALARRHPGLQPRCRSPAPRVSAQAREPVVAARRGGFLPYPPFSTSAQRYSAAASSCWRVLPTVAKATVALCS